MWHIDEGTLHAFLDDRERGPAAGALDVETRARVVAHLHACDVCSAQLQRAGQQRDRASRILLAAAPQIESPPFEAVTPKLATAIMPPAPRTGRARGGWVPLAWAASLVLAVGAGWMGSLLWREVGAPRPLTEQAPAAPAERGQRAASPVQGAASPVQQATSPVQQAAGPVLTAAAPAQAARAAPETAPPAASGGAAGRAAPSAAAPQPLGGDRRAERKLADAADVGVAAQGTGVAMQKVETNQAAQAPARPSANAAGAVGEERTRAAGEAMARANVLGATAAAPSELRASPRRELAFAPEVAGAGYPGDADVAWETVTRAAAERFLAAPLYLVADAPILELAIAPRANPALLRVRQRTPEGAVELLQWRAARTEPGAPLLRSVPAAPPGAAGLVADTRTARDGGRFVVVPGTTHPVLLKAAAGVDPAPLLPRVQPAR